MTGIVLDASVVGKWFLGDEPGGDRAVRLRERVVAGDLVPIAPVHLPLELAAALLRAVRRGRFRAELVGPALATIDAFEIEIANPPGLAGNAAEVGLALGLHPFDAAYLVVARLRGVPLITADRPLRDAGLRMGFDVVLLGDVPG